MPFTEKTIMDERLCFIAACLREDEAMSTLCQRYGISRKTGYKWLGRYRELGAVGLEDRSRAPQTLPHCVPGKLTDQVLAVRALHPTWGPRKLLAWLRMSAPNEDWPAASTIGDLLLRRGLTHARKARRKASISAGPQIEATASNESWSADFKGWFRTKDGIRCEPLTISDNYSRYLFVCHALPRLTFDLVQPHFEAAFRSHGLPRAIRTDNGSPFAHNLGLGGLTRLSVWFLKLGIWPDRTMPGRPDQNGRHERMHRTLAEDTASPPADTIALQQVRLDQWRQDYNTNRPHEALGQRCPAHLHQPSQRSFPDVIRPWDYPVDHYVKRVNTKGYIMWKGEKLYLTEALLNEDVGIARQDDGEWMIRYRDFDLAVLDQLTGQIQALRPARAGRRAKLLPMLPV
jgi:putative transposase